MKNKQQNRKTTSDDYRYEILHTEEMSMQEIESLAMCVATCIHEELQKVAIRAMKNIFPQFNPLNDPLHYKGEPVEIDEATSTRYPYVLHCTGHLQQYPGIRTNITEISFDVTPTVRKPVDNEGESE